MISTSNLSQDDWKLGTNLFWVGNFNIDNQTDRNGYARVEDTHPKYNRLFGENLNMNFLQSL